MHVHWVWVDHVGIVKGHWERSDDWGEERVHHSLFLSVYCVLAFSVEFLVSYLLITIYNFFQLRDYYTSLIEKENFKSYCNTLEFFIYTLYMKKYWQYKK